MNLENVKWGSLLIGKKEKLLNNAFPIDGSTGTVKKGDGKCIIDFCSCKFSIPGEIINGEIVIKDEAIFYNPSNS